MNAQQKQKIKEIIAKDATLCCHYINNNRETCIIGGLIMAADPPPEIIDKIKAANQTTIGMLTDIVTFLDLKYGLSVKNLMMLQHKNDATHNIEERHQILIDYIDELEVNLDLT